MKKISKIVIDNYRAYWDRKTIELPNGENLLIYGENGSGKSSLYRGLDGFLNSFVKQVPFEKNKFNPGVGKIELTFGDFTPETQTFVEDTNVAYSFQDGQDNTNVENVAFLKAAAMTKGFMDYKDLLRVYLHEGTKNLFNLIVENVLRNHRMRNTTIGNEWKRINVDFYDAERSTKLSHRRVPARLNDLREQLNSIFHRIEPTINSYLTNYFPEFKISIEFRLENLSCQGDGPKRNWNINSELYLIVRSNGLKIDNYEEFLNEARLSAIALCIYLAALKDNESQFYKILFLDDVFIGLDAANRRPILRILQEHFSDYQIIISTYDRYWFNLAKHFFKIEMPHRWKAILLYVGEKSVNNIETPVFNPIMIESDSNLDKAAKYLHHRTNPDYPAAANYLRKALEEKLAENFPYPEFTEDDDFSQFESYELTKRIKKARKFLNNIHSDYDGLSALDEYMHVLLHPMSHFNEEDQVYRSELFDVERLLKCFDEEFAEIKNRYLL